MGYSYLWVFLALVTPFLVCTQGVVVASKAIMDMGTLFGIKEWINCTSHFGEYCYGVPGILFTGSNSKGYWPKEIAIGVNMFPDGNLKTVATPTRQGVINKPFPSTVTGLNRLTLFSFYGSWEGGSWLGPFPNATFQPEAGWPPLSKIAFTFTPNSPNGGFSTPMNDSFCSFLSPSLMEANFSGSHLGGISALQKCKYLRKLDLSHNGFSGELPSFFTNMTNLQWLNLASNSFNGPFPDTWGAMNNLTELYLQGNNFNVGLPDSWKTMSALRLLNVAENNLIGELPSSWSSLSNLQHLTLSDNNLEGSIPHLWSTLFNLTHLSIPRNRMDGKLNKTFYVLPSKLEYIDLSNNQLSGSLPLWNTPLVSQHNLSYLDLSNNQFHGELPFTWPIKLPLLRTLQLSNNNFSGTIPKWKNFTLLEVVNLSNNQFEGPLPAGWRNSTTKLSLKYFNISNNMLSGEIHGLLENATMLNILDMSYNQFSGPLPEEWKTLIQIQLMDVSHNNFSGVLPSEWSLALSNMTELQLGENHLLTGGIPASWQVPLGNNLETLLLQNTHITSLDGLFGTSYDGLSVVQRINAKNASLSSVSGNIQFLHHLNWLDISDNNISATGAFCSQCNEPHSSDIWGSSLVYLDLSANSLEAVPKMLNHLAESKGLSQMLNLNISSNPIQLFSVGFSQLEYLNVLGLRDTNITTLDHVTFPKNIVLLDLTENPKLNITQVVSHTTQTTFRVTPIGATRIHSDYNKYDCDGLIVGISGSVKFNESAYDYLYCSCETNYFGKVPKNCRTCPRDGPAECTNGEMRYKQGYYPHTSAHVSQSKDVSLAMEAVMFDDFVICLSPKACRNSTFVSTTGKLFNCTAHGRKECFDAVCHIGYTARLCSKCKEDYYAHEGQCLRCTHLTVGEIVLMIILVIMAFLLFVVLQGFRLALLLAQLVIFIVLVLTGVVQETVLVIEVVLIILHSILEAKGTEPTLKILIFFLQATSLLAPKEMWEVIDSSNPIHQLQSVNLQPVGVECIFSELRDPTLHLAFKLLLPIPFFLIVIIIILGRHIVQKAYHWCSIRLQYQPSLFFVRLIFQRSWNQTQYTTESEDEYSIVFTKGKDTLQGGTNLPAYIVHSWLFLLHTMYFSLVTTIVATMKPNGQDRHGNEYGFMSPPYSWVKISGDTYIQIRTIGSIGLLVYVLGIPFLFLVLLVMGRKAIQRRSEVTQRWFGFLYDGYHTKVYWFELVAMVRRNFLALGVTLVPQYSLLGPFFTLFTLVISGFVHYVIQPFEQLRHNILELIALSIIGITYACGQIMLPSIRYNEKLQDPEWEVPSQNGFVQMLLTVNVVTFAAILLVYIADSTKELFGLMKKHWRSKRTTLLDSSEYLLSTKVEDCS